MLPYTHDSISEVLANLVDVPAWLSPYRPWDIRCTCLTAQERANHGLNSPQFTSVINAKASLVMLAYALYYKILITLEAYRIICWLDVRTCYLHVQEIPMPLSSAIYLTKPVVLKADAL